MPRGRISRLASGALDWAVGVRDLALAAWPRAHDTDGPGSGTCTRLPVVVLPGILENPRYLWGLTAFLRAAGHPVTMVRSLGLNLAPLGVSVELVFDQLAAEGVRGAVVVAHSKGGLIGKAMLLDARSVGVLSAMVSIATPFSGSLLWPRAQRSFAVRRSPLGLFDPEADELVALALRGGANARIVSLAPAHDQVVPAGSYLEGATNVTLPVSGHFRAVRDPHTWEVVHHHIHRLG